MGFPILMGSHLYIESGPWYYCHQLLLEWMNCFECVNSFLRVHTKFNEQKTVLLYFITETLRVKPGTSEMLNDTVIKMANSCRYLGHMITNGLDNNDNIKRKLHSFYGKANMLVRTFNYRSSDVKKMFSSYYGSLYTSGASTLYGQYRQMYIAYNNVFRRLMGYHKFCSASGMFVENRIDNVNNTTIGLWLKWKIDVFRKLPC